MQSPSTQGVVQRAACFSAYFSACLAALCSSPAIGQTTANAAGTSAVTVYGFLKVNVEQVGASGMSGPLRRLSNNQSVLGFRAVEALGDGLQAWAQIESNVKVDTGDGPWGGRNTGIGLRGSAGEILLGQWETPLRFVSVYAIDPFTASIFASNSILGNGFTTAANGVTPASFDRRQPNLIQWSSPVLQGVSARIAYAVPEEKTASTSPDLLSTLLSYQAGPLYLAWGHERHRDYLRADSLDTADRLAAAYSFGPTRLRATWEQLRYQPGPGTQLKRNAWQVAVTHNIGIGQLRASWVQGEASTGNASKGLGSIGAPGTDSAAHQIALGYGHTLSARTELWGGWTRLSNGANSSYNLSANGIPNLKPGQDPYAWGLGMTHKF